MDYQGFRLTTNVREDPALRQSFFDLARATFGLDFAPWYASGGWTDLYRPYALEKDGEVVANVSVNLTRLRRGESVGLFVQLGTVMTRSDLRKRGLGRFLMERVLEDWSCACQGIYLFANDSATGYYPRFGFSASFETEHVLPLPDGGAGLGQPLRPGTPSEEAVVRGFLTRSNPYAALDLVDNPGLLWFYLGGLCREELLYLPEDDALLVQRLEGADWTVDGVLGGGTCPLEALLRKAAPPQARRVRLGFTPIQAPGAQSSPLQEEGTTLFVYAKLENPFGETGLRLPALAHA